MDNQRLSTQFKAKHEQRCGQFCGVLAMLALLLAILMLYFALVTQYSEQRTTYWILFVLSFLSLALLSGIAVQQISSGKEKMSAQQAYNANLSFIQKQYLNQQLNMQSRYSQRQY